MCWIILELHPATAKKKKQTKKQSREDWSQISNRWTQYLEIPKEVTIQI